MAAMVEIVKEPCERTGAKKNMLDPDTVPHQEGVSV